MIFLPRESTTLVSSFRNGLCSSAPPRLSKSCSSPPCSERVLLYPPSSSPTCTYTPHRNSNHSLVRATKIHSFLFLIFFLFLFSSLSIPAISSSYSLILIVDNQKGGRSDPACEPPRADPWGRNRDPCPGPCPKNFMFSESEVDATRRRAAKIHIAGAPERLHAASVGLQASRRAKACRSRRTQQKKTEVLLRVF